MEYFIAQLQIVLPVLGVSILRSTSVRNRKPTQSPPVVTDLPLLETDPDGIQPSAIGTPVFHLRVRRSPNRYADATEVDSEFVVLAGSFASNKLGTMNTGYKATRERLVKNGILETVNDDASVLRLKQDYVFRSPSEAASVMNAGSENGLTRWVSQEGTTFGEWQSSVR